MKEPCEYQHSEEKRKYVMTLLSICADSDKPGRPPSKRYIQSLLSRIESLERQVADYEGRKVPSQGSIPIDQQSRHLISDSAPQDSVQELVDLCGGLSLGEGQELRFFDSRSNLALVAEQLDERCHDHLLKFSANRSQRPGIGEVEVDPSTQEVLLSVFWRWQNSWQYLVHESA